MAEILESESFVCHKTIGGDEGDLKQCAGYMHLAGDRSLFVRITKATGYKLNLVNRGLIFDNPEDCIKHHKRDNE
jgi:hypothetical protein